MCAHVTHSLFRTEFDTAIMSFGITIALERSGKGRITLNKNNAKRLDSNIRPVIFQI